MAAEEVQREYRLTDPELALFTSNLVSDMTRDAAEFNNFGVDSADISTLQSLGNQFEVFPSDEMLEGEAMVATDAKNEKIEQVKEEIRNMAVRVEMKWGENSGQYKRLGIKGMNNMADDTLLFTSRRVHSVMTDYLADLASEGLTQQMLNDYEALNEALESAKNTQHDKINERDVKRVERIVLGNELYSFVSKYCDIGKRIWFKIDPAKYDDYVIYKTEGGLPGKVLNLSYDMPSGALSWDEPASPDPIDKYELERSTDGDNWTVVYEGAATEAQVPLLAGENYFRCHAHNKNGWGDWSDTLELNVGGIDAPSWVKAVYSGIPPKVTEEQVEVTWANVAPANMYEVWRSVVDVGVPAGDFTEIGEVDSEMYLDFDLTQNKRNYYFIIAKNDTERSEPSVQAWDDIVD